MFFINILQTLYHELLVLDCNILIFDEPTSFLDIKDRMELYATARRLISAGKSILWITKDINEIILSDYVIKLVDGEVVFSNNIVNYIQKSVSCLNSV